MLVSELAAFRAWKHVAEEAGIGQDWDTARLWSHWERGGDALWLSGAGVASLMGFSVSEAAGCCPVS